MKKLFSAFLIFLLVFSCAVPSFAAGENPELTLDGLMEAYESGDKEKLDFYFQALGIPTDVSGLPSAGAISPRWASSQDNEDLMCHESLTGYGILLYLSSMQRLLGLQLSAMGYTFSDIQTLVQAVRTPDTDAALGWMQAFAGHFYDPDTGVNFVFKSNNTAKGNLEINYSGAFFSYQHGNRTEAMKRLGCALHYLQDLNEPHHASNAVAVLTNHTRFEEEASELLFEMAESNTWGGLEPDWDFYIAFLSRGIGESGRQAAITAKGFKSLATSQNFAFRRIAALCTLSNAMLYTSGLLFRFAKDTHML